MNNSGQNEGFHVLDELVCDARPNESFVFQRATSGLRKPIMRFRFASGRNVELLAFHIEPAYSFTGEKPRPIIDEVIGRLYPDERPVLVGEIDRHSHPAFLCIGYFYSDTPAKGKGCGLSYSVLLIGTLIENVNRDLRSLACELLAKVDWEAKGGVSQLR